MRVPVSKIVRVKADKGFAYFDRLGDGSYQLSYSTSFMEESIDAVHFMPGGLSIEVEWTGKLALPTEPELEPAK